MRGLLVASRVLRVAIAVAGAAAVVIRADLARADAPPAFSESALGRMLEPYGAADDPRALRALLRSQKESLPPAVLLALADGLLRTHRVRMATVALEEALARTDEPDVAVWAAFGLGWISLASGRPADARQRFEVIVEDGAWGAPTATALMELTRAAEGGGGNAAARLTEIATAAETTYALRVVARLLAGYALYWSGQYDAAAKALSSAADEYPGTPVTDDAAYAGAWALYRSGERGLAIAELRIQAGQRVPVVLTERRRALVGLEPASVLGATLQRYRGASIRAPEELMVQMLDLDGAGLAASALAILEGPGTAETAKAPRAESDLSPVATPAFDAAPPAAEAPAPATGSGGGKLVSPDRTWLLVVLLLLVVLAAALVLRQRRRHPATS